MPQSTFYSHLLKVTIAQMLKAHGFDRSASRPLEVLSDLCTKYIRLLIIAVLKFTELRNDTEPNIQDLARAFIELKIITPAKLLDGFDMDSLTEKGIENFERWFMSDMNNRMREVARPSVEFLRERREARMKLKDVNSKMSNLTKALDQQTKQAQLQNPTLPYQPLASSKPIASFDSHSQNNSLAPEGRENSVNTGKSAEQYDEVNEGDGIPRKALEEDWIRYVIREMLSDQPDLKFKGTVLMDYVPDDKKSHIDANPNHDFLIVGPMSEKLLHTFPYYKSDDEIDDSEEEDNVVNLNDENSDTDLEKNSLHVVNDHKELDEFDFYEHHHLYDEEEELDLYGQGANDSHNLNLFG